MLDRTLSREPPAARLSFQSRLSKPRTPQIKVPDISEENLPQSVSQLVTVTFQTVPSESNLFLLFREEMLSRHPRKNREIGIRAPN